MLHAILMKRLAFFAFTGVAFSMAACSGSEKSCNDGTGASSGSAGSGEAGSAGSNKAGQSGSGGSTADSGLTDAPIEGGADCESVRQQLGELLPLAQACDPSLNMVQCNAIVDG